MTSRQDECFLTKSIFFIDSSCTTQKVILMKKFLKQIDQLMLFKLTINQGTALDSTQGGCPWTGWGSLKDLRVLATVSGPCLHCSR